MTITTTTTIIIIILYKNIFYKEKIYTKPSTRADANVSGGGTRFKRRSIGIVDMIESYDTESLLLLTTMRLLSKSMPVTVAPKRKRERGKLS